MDIVLYQFPGACSRVTLNALEEIGCPYRLQTVNIRNGAQLTPEYLALNPKGKVPAVAFDGRVLTENPAILYALHLRHPAAGLLPLAERLPESFQGLSDLSWCSSTLHPIVRQVRMPAKWTTGEPEGVAADGKNKMAKECARLNERLADGRWWYADRWSIIDVYVYWAYSTAAKGGFSLETYPNLLAHAGRVRERPGFQRALQAEIESARAAHLDIPINLL